MAGGRALRLSVSLDGRAPSDELLLSALDGVSCELRAGEVDAYVHGGGQYEWDSCAPVAVARAAGVWASRLDGSPLVYNNADPYRPDLLICRPELAERVLAALSSFDD